MKSKNNDISGIVSQGCWRSFHVEVSVFLKKVDLIGGVIDLSFRLCCTFWAS